MVLNNKVIWDNTEFEDILLGDKYEPGNYLPVKRVDDETASIGGWKINVRSTVDINATPEDIIEGYSKLSLKLKINIQRLFLPFFAADIWDYDPKKELQIQRAAYEPMVVLFLRLCYWYHRCNNISPTIERKNKEIRDKLKVSNSLLNLIRTSGLQNEIPKEWIRQAIGVIYELVCASLSYQCSQVISFEKKHDFILEATPAEVKTKFPPVDAKYGDEFYPSFNAKLYPNVDLKQVLLDIIKMPEIMENNLRYAIENQEGEIIFLNFILENESSILRFLSEYVHTDLTFKNAITEAVKLFNDDLCVPLLINFFAVHCNYEIYSVMVPIPVKKENSEISVDMSRI